MKTTQFDTSTAEMFHIELNEAMQDIAAKYGLKLKPTSARYTRESFSKKVEFHITETTAGEEFSMEAKEWKMYAKYCGLNEEWLNRSFVDPRGGQVLIIKGWRNRNRKDKIILETPAGQQFKAPVDYVKNAMQIS